MFSLPRFPISPWSLAPPSVFPHWVVYPGPAYAPPLGSFSVGPWPSLRPLSPSYPGPSCALGPSPLHALGHKLPWNSVRRTPPASLLLATHSAALRWRAVRGSVGTAQLCWAEAECRCGHSHSSLIWDSFQEDAAASNHDGPAVSETCGAWGSGVLKGAWGSQCWG